MSENEDEFMVELRERNAVAEAEFARWGQEDAEHQAFLADLQKNPVAWAQYEELRTQMMKELGESRAAMDISGPNLFADMVAQATCPGGCGSTSNPCEIDRSWDLGPGAPVYLYCGRSPCHEELGGPQARAAWDRMTEAEKDAWRNAPENN